MICRWPKGCRWISVHYSVRQNFVKITRLLNFAGVVFAVTGLFAADTKTAGTLVTSPLVSFPATSQMPGPMANGVLVWESMLPPITTNISAADWGRNWGIAKADRR